MRLVAFLLLLLAAGAQAQPSFGVIEDRQTNVPAYFFHVLPGEATIRVYVWGTVGAPGLYVVSDGTDLGELLTLAGGPPVQQERQDVRVETTVRLYRMTGGARSLVYEAPVAQVVREPASYPALSDDDLVEVETQVEEVRAFTWRDAVSIVTGVAAVALAIERISSLF